MQVEVGVKVEAATVTVSLRVGQEGQCGKLRWEHWLELGRRGRQACPVQSGAALVQDVGHYLGSSEKPFKDIKLQIIG